MAALRSRCGHYSFVLLISFFLLSFFLSLFMSIVTGRPLYFCPVVSSIFCLFIYLSIPAVADWMSAIFPHMVRPWCEFRMQVRNVLHAARWKCRTQQIAKKSPSGHHRTTLSGYIFATKARIDNRKKFGTHVLTIW